MLHLSCYLFWAFSGLLQNPSELASALIFIFILHAGSLEMLREYFCE
jgi:hypothetical protein